MHFIQTTSQKSYNYTLICSGIIPIDNKPISTAHLSQMASFIWGRQESMHIQRSLVTEYLPSIKISSVFPPKQTPSYIISPAPNAIPGHCDLLFPTECKEACCEPLPGLVCPPNCAPFSRSLLLPRPRMPMNKSGVIVEAKS